MARTSVGRIAQQSGPVTAARVTGRPADQQITAASVNTFVCSGRPPDSALLAIRPIRTEPIRKSHFSDSSTAQIFPIRQQIPAISFCEGNKRLD